jgi:hypothetical protein
MRLDLRIEPHVCVWFNAGSRDILDLAAVALPAADAIK